MIIRYNRDPRQLSQYLHEPFGTLGGASLDVWFMSISSIPHQLLWRPPALRAKLPALKKTRREGIRVPISLLIWVTSLLGFVKDLNRLMVSSHTHRPTHRGVGGEGGGPQNGPRCTKPHEGIDPKPSIWPILTILGSPPRRLSLIGL